MAKSLKRPTQKPPKRPVGLITAVPFEAGIILKKAGLKPVEHFPLPGTLGGRQIAYAASGVGITNAAHAATVLIEKFSPQAIINFGIGGAYPSSGLNIGDVVVARKEIYADTGLYLEGGIRGMEEMGFPLLRKAGKKLFNEFQLDKGFVKLAKGLGYGLGVFLTVAASTGTLKRALELEGRFKAVCENMEGAAIAHVSAIYGVPFLELRGISNIVKDRNPKEWDKESASQNCQRAVIEILEALSLTGL